MELFDLFSVVIRTGVNIFKALFLPLREYILGYAEDFSFIVDLLDLSYLGSNILDSPLYVLLFDVGLIVITIVAMVKFFAK